jgi:hypothetical protein
MDYEDEEDEEDERPAFGRFGYDGESDSESKTEFNAKAFHFVNQDPDDYEEAFAKDVAMIKQHWRSILLDVTQYTIGYIKREKRHWFGVEWQLYHSPREFAHSDTREAWGILERMVNPKFINAVCAVHEFIEVVREGEEGSLHRMLQQDMQFQTMVAEVAAWKRIMDDAHASLHGYNHSKRVREVPIEGPWDIKTHSFPTRVLVTNAPDPRPAAIQVLKGLEARLERQQRLHEQAPDVFPSNELSIRFMASRYVSLIDPQLVATGLCRPT